MGLKISKGFALGKIVRKLVEITEPGITILPIGVGVSFHQGHFLILADFGKGIFSP
jgi:hypothetical protein